MKIKFQISIGLLFLITFGACSNYLNDSTGSGKLFKTNLEMENKGRAVTSVGELRTLFIFSSFKDDASVKSSGWEFSMTDMPDWTKTIINESTVLNFPHNNLSKYFFEMSHGNLLLYGDIYPELVVPKFFQKKYKSIADVNTEILKSLDNKIDFSRYDNWRKGKNNKLVNEADGKVDLIFIVYRNFEDRLFFNNGWTGAAHLYLNEDIQTNDNVKITSGRLDQGSGIQSRGGKNGYTYMKYVLAHEFGHMLFGAGHIENVTNLALMTGGPVWNASRGMHSWEKAHLNWIDFVDISLKENSTITIDDYHTTGEVYRIKLSDNEWFLLENHQKLSSNDWAEDKGLYISHIKNPHSFAPQITIECADGNWDFNIDVEKKKLFKSKPNPSGKSELNFSKYVKKKSYACYDEVYGDNSAWGDDHDAFDVVYNNLFSSKSNPSSENSSSLDFAIEVKDLQGSELVLNVWIDDIYENTPPSKPQLLDVEIKNKNSVLIKWLSNKEPDIQQYKIYRSTSSKSQLVNIMSMSAVNNNKRLENSISQLINDANKLYRFCITAVDDSGKESVFSDIIELSFVSAKKTWSTKRIEQL